MDGILGSSGAPLDAVLEFKLENDEIVKRLSGRRVCKSCGAIFHVIFEKPKKDGICDNCQGELNQRDDDKESVIQNRLDVYSAQTSPIINYYKDANLLRTISGVGEVNEISERAIAALE